MKTAAKKTGRGRKLDRKLVSNQKHELDYESDKLGVSKKKLSEIKTKSGRSRKAIEKK